jgi:hypothetical protein
MLWTDSSSTVDGYPSVSNAIEELPKPGSSRIIVDGNEANHCQEHPEVSWSER